MHEYYGVFVNPEKTHGNTTKTLINQSFNFHVQVENIEYGWNIM